MTMTPCHFIQRHLIYSHLVYYPPLTHTMIMTLYHSIKYISSTAIWSTNPFDDNDAMPFHRKTFHLQPFSRLTTTNPFDDNDTMSIHQKTSPLQPFGPSLIHMMTMTPCHFVERHDNDAMPFLLKPFGLPFNIFTHRSISQLACKVKLIYHYYNKHHQST